MQYYGDVMYLHWCWYRPILDGSIWWKYLSDKSFMISLDVTEEAELLSCPGFILGRWCQRRRQVNAMDAHIAYGIYNYSTNVHTDERYVASMVRLHRAYEVASILSPNQRLFPRGFTIESTLMPLIQRWSQICGAKPKTVTSYSFK